MVLDTVGGVLEEQCRIYRLTCNGHLKPAEMSQMLSGLREIRQTLDSLPPEPQTYQPPSIRIVTVDSGQFFSDNQLQEMSGLKLIDHHHEPVAEQPLLERAPADACDGAIHHGLHSVHPPRLQQDPKTSREALADRLAALPDRMLFALAGIDDADTK